MNPIEKYYPLIGKTVVEFQDLDCFLNYLLMFLLNEDPNVSMALVVSLSFAKKVDVIKSIAPFKFKYKDLHDSLKELIPQLTSSEERRNQIIHGAWIGSSVEDKVFFHKPQTSRKHGMKTGGIRHATTKEIEDTIKVIQKAKNSIFKLGAELERRNIIKVHFFNIGETGPNLRPAH